MKTLQEALLWRSAIKEYDTTVHIEDSAIDTLLDSVRMSATSYGLQPYKVLIIKNPEVREKLKTLSYNQAQVTDASHFVVFASRKDENEKDVKEYIERIAKARGVTVESLAGYEDMMNGSLSHMDAQSKTSWAAKQAYIGLGTLLVAAALHEIDASPMEGFDANAYDETLGLTAMGHTTVVTCALGARAETDEYSKFPKVRKSVEEFIQTV